MIFSEDSRVKIPCILHLVRIGYQYIFLKNATWDENTNIFPELLEKYDKVVSKYNQMGFARSMENQQAYPTPRLAPPHADERPGYGGVKEPL